MNVGRTIFKLSMLTASIIRTTVSLCLFYAIAEVSSYWLKIAFLVMFTGYTTLSVYWFYRQIRAFFALKKLLDNVN